MATYAFVLPDRRVFPRRIIQLPAEIPFKLFPLEGDEGHIILETPSGEWQNDHMGGLELRGRQGRIITLRAVGASTKSSLGQLKNGRLENGMHYPARKGVFRSYAGLVNSHEDFPDRDYLVIRAPRWTGLQVVTSF